MTAADPGLSVLDLAAGFLRRRVRLIALCTIAVLLAGTFSLLTSKQYTARTILTPESASPALSASGLAGLASRFGVGIGLGETSLPFYADLVRSEDFLARLVHLRLATTGDSVTLLDHYIPEPDSLAIRLQEAREQALDDMVPSVNHDANTLTIEFTTTDPVLSATAANAFQQLINEFNVTTRQSQAKSLRVFLDSIALPNAAGELSAAEDSLAVFYERNRTFESSAALRLVEARLQRRITLKQQSYLDLAAQMEQARVDEIRNTPVVTVVSPATPPPKPSSPRLIVNLAIALILAFSLWVMSVVAESYFAVLRADDPEAVGRLRQEAGNSVAPMRRMLGRQPDDRREVS